MADITKYEPINGGTLISDFKTHFSIHRTKKTITVAYGFVFLFIAFTIFLAFSPSSNSSSPWFTNIFTVNPNSTTSILSDDSYRSHFSSFLTYFFPNSTQSQNAASQNIAFSPPNLSTESPVLQKNETLSPKAEVLKPSVNHTVNINTNPHPDVKNQAQNKQGNGKSGVLKQNQDQNKQGSDKNETLKQNQTQNKQGINKNEAVKNNQTQNKQMSDKNGALKQNQTQNKQMSDRNEVSEKNHTQNKKMNDEKEVLKQNHTEDKQVNDKNEVLEQNQTNNGDFHDKVEVNGIAEKGLVKNLTSSLIKKQSNSTKGTVVKQGIDDDVIKSLMNCDMFDGNWVSDESYPLYKPGSCSLIDEQFNCFLNGRPDNAYYKLKWKPKGCTLPRLNGSHMLEMLRGKRLVFVGDSLNRNMWESLICILKNSVKDQKKVYEEFGRHHFRTEASYSFVFEDYKCTVEFFVAPFLVQEWETTDKKGTKKETLRLDIIERSADNYKHADVIVFNTGHWWTHEKTSTGKDYYQEGSHIYSELNVLEAFRKALTTWGRWVDANVNPMKSLVFFRGYSASHFSGGQWNSGGQCDHETEPIKNETYLTPYPPKMSVLEKVLKGMKNRATYLNVTRLTDYRKDGHPSIYRKLHYSDEETKSPLRFQDCSHWCLPGVPDSWNEILYAELLVKLNKQQVRKS